MHSNVKSNFHASAATLIKPTRPNVGRLDYHYPTRDVLLATISTSNTTSSATSSKYPTTLVWSLVRAYSKALTNHSRVAFSVSVTGFKFCVGMVPPVQWQHTQSSAESPYPYPIGLHTSGHFCLEFRQERLPVHPCAV